MGRPSTVQTIGPWTIVRMIARCPAVDLFAAQQGTKNALLQVVLLRPAADEEAKQQVAYTRTIAELTESLTPDPDVELVDHGLGERPEGGNALYWAMPWNEAADLIRAGGPELESPDELVILTHDLLERLARRHEGQRLDPILSESLVVTRGALGSTVLGFPLVVDPGWTDEDMAPPRLAAHEAQEETPKPDAKGDMFRLGRALEELGRPLGALPGPFVDLIRRFQGHDEPLNDAREAIELLERLDHEGGLGLRSKTLSASRIASAQTVVEPTRGPSGLDVARLRAETQVSPRPATPWESDEDEDTAMTAEPRRVETRSDASITAPPGAMYARDSDFMGTDEDRDPSASDAPTLALERTELDLPRTLIRPGPTQASDEWTDDALVRLESPQPPDDDAPGHTQANVPGLPPPEWSESEGPQGTVIGVRLPSRQDLTRPVSSGYRGGPDPRRPRRAHHHPMRPMYPLPPPGPVLPGAVPPPVDPSGDVADVPDVSVSKNSYLFAAIGVFVAGVLAFLAAEFFVERPDGDSGRREPEQAQVLRPPRDVTVKVQPENASVFSAEDGTFLGAGATRILVGSEPPSVAVSAPGFVPVEVDLPRRGTLSVELLPSDDESQCSVRVRPPKGVTVEPTDESAVAVEKGRRWTTWEFRGAALFVATQGRGAWVVACPEPGAEAKAKLDRRSTPRDVELEITWPTQGEIFIDGEPQGNAPMKRMVANRFVKVRAETPDGAVERWLPVFSDTRAELPEPIAP